MYWSITIKKMEIKISIPKAFFNYFKNKAAGYKSNGLLKDKAFEV